MKTRMAIMLALVAFLLLSGLALAQAGGPGLAPVYAIQAGASTGGGYQLTGLVWHVSGTAGGGAYNLATSHRVTGGGNQCCCTFLPLVLRSH